MSELTVQSTCWREMTKCLLVLCVILASSNLPANAEWVLAQGGVLPPNALIGGQNSNGQPLYICRVKFEGSIFPGMTGPSKTCDISHEGKTYFFSKYKVLVGDGYSWAAVYEGEIPFDAFSFGEESQGNVRYICRGDVESHWYPGNISQTNKGCSISYEGKAKTVYWYEVLVGN
jgi:hypothetical protein